MEVAIKSLMFSDMREVTTEGNTPNIAKSNLEVVVPCIRNTAEIAAGQELVLRWEKKDGKKRIGDQCIQGVEKESAMHSASKLPAPRRAECKESLRTGCWGSAG